MSLSRILKRPGGIPWFMIPIPDLDTSTGAGFANAALSASSSLIFTDTLPREVSDEVPINYSYTQIPGGRGEIPRFGSIGSRRVKLSIDLVNFNTDLGVSDQLAQFSALRKPTINVLAAVGSPVQSASQLAVGATAPTPSSSLTKRAFVPFTSNPSVLYWHGVSSLTPLIYRVTKCDFQNSFLNEFGRPQKSTVNIELVEDISTVLSTAEAIMTYLLGVYRTVKNIQGLTRKAKGHPFRQKAGF